MQKANYICTLITFIAYHYPRAHQQEPAKLKLFSWLSIFFAIYIFPRCLCCAKRKLKFMERKNVERSNSIDMLRSKSMANLSISAYRQIVHQQYILSIKLNKEFPPISKCQLVKPHCLRQIYYFGWSRGLWQQEESNLSIGMRLIEHTKQPINSTRIHNLSLSFSLSLPHSHNRLVNAFRCACTQFVHRFDQCIVVPCRFHWPSNIYPFWKSRALLLERLILSRLKYELQIWASFAWVCRRAFQMKQVSKTFLMDQWN